MHANFDLKSGTSKNLTSMLTNILTMMKVPTMMNQSLLTSSNLPLKASVPIKLVVYKSAKKPENFKLTRIGIKAKFIRKTVSMFFAKDLLYSL